MIIICFSKNIDVVNVFRKTTLKYILESDWLHDTEQNRKEFDFIIPIMYPASYILSYPIIVNFQDSSTVFHNRQPYFFYNKYTTCRKLQWERLHLQLLQLQPSKCSCSLYQYSSLSCNAISSNLKRGSYSTSIETFLCIIVHNIQIYPPPLLIKENK